MLEGSRELIRDIYGTHRDKESADSDWEYDRDTRVFSADVPCAWCDDAKIVLDGLEAELARLRGEATVRPAGAQSNNSATPASDDGLLVNGAPAFASRVAPSGPDSEQ